MNNFVIGLKRFFKNKNVITIILVLVILAVLYYGYSRSIKEKTDPISIPVAARTIGPKTEITADDIVYVEVANSIVGENVITYSGSVIGKYTNVGVTIPEGGMFYNGLIINKENVPGSWIEQLDYEKGELPYYMDINYDDTIGNSILPGTYIDIYMQATDENGTIMFGKLMKNINVLVVHDSQGNDVFGNPDEAGYPSKLGFAVNQDTYILLKKIEYLGLDLVIMPRGSRVPTNNYLIVASSTLRDYVDAQTITVEEDIISDNSNSVVE